MAPLIVLIPDDIIFEIVPIRKALDELTRRTLIKKIFKLFILYFLLLFFVFCFCFESNDFLNITRKTFILV